MTGDLPTSSVDLYYLGRYYQQLYRAVGPGLVSGGEQRLERLHLPGVIVALTRVMEELRSCPLDSPDTYKQLIYAANLEGFLRFSVGLLHAIRLHSPVSAPDQMRSAGAAFRSTFGVLVPMFPDEFLGELSCTIAETPANAVDATLEVAFAQSILVETAGSLLKTEHEEFDTDSALSPDDGGFFEVLVDLTKSLERETAGTRMADRMLSLEAALADVAERLSQGRVLQILGHDTTTN